MARKKTDLIKATRIKMKLTNFSQGVNSNIDEFCLPFKTGKRAYNLNFSTGALTSGIGIKSLSVKNALYPNANYPEQREYYPVAVDGTFNPIRAWHYRHYDANNNYTKADKILFVSKTHTLMQVSIPSSTFGLSDDIGTITLSGRPVDAINYRLNGRDVLILTYEDSPMQIYDASNPNATKLTTISTAPNIISMCVHYERLFAVVANNRNAVYFSSELDPTQWEINLNGAGFIEMIDERGQLTKVISLNGYVYIFREYGIARLTAFAEQQDFVVSQLFTSCGRIFEDTIDFCGNRVLFLAEDGLYSFDGSITTKLTMNIESMFFGKDNKNAVGAYFQGKYYLACNLNFGDGLEIDCETTNYVNNAVLQIDLKTGDLNISRGFDISFFTSVSESSKSQLVCCHNSYTLARIGEIVEGDGKLYGVYLEKSWLTPKTDFNYPNALKIIREIYLISKYDCSLTITSDLEQKVLNITGNDKLQRINCCLKGHIFNFEFKTNETMVYISSPEFVVDVLKE